MSYNFTNLNEDEFEKLVVNICRVILGIGAASFAKGTDGGRDSRFYGRAERYPSSAKPWEGAMIVQAKFTAEMNASYGDTRFYSKKGTSATLNREFDKIKNLAAQNEMDYYLLFSNRRKTPNQEDMLKKAIAAAGNIPAENVAIFGLEELSSYCAMYPVVMKGVNLFPMDSPLNITSNELVEVIEALAEAIHNKENVDSMRSNLTRTSYKEKNKENKLSDEYATVMQRAWVSYDHLIRAFLANPDNARYAELLEDSAIEMQRHIVVNQQRDMSMDENLNYILDWILRTSYELSSPSNKRLLKALVYYLYFNCDIGKQYVGD